jgi:ankyrin repeat protein
MLQMLVDNSGGAIDIRGLLGRAPLHLAFRSGSLPCVNYLLDRGLRCSDIDRAGNTALFYACSSKSMEVIGKILELDSSTVNSLSPWIRYTAHAAVGIPKRRETHSR